ncbi:uncharacterized protein At4g06744-like [Argentina anserina]|uniref:uncharacterized protein At4g06744-like n=1 Tax=Argentina anserina TaxID=57926 RepID=UPI0021765CE9|nr:uncharacterized protein At4g06744-like [Potentilla anserina]
MSSNISIFTSILLSICFLHVFLQHDRVEAQPGGFASPRIRNAFNVIQNFKSKIQSDPKNVTGTWVGNDVCKYKGFLCAVVPDFKQKSVIGVDFNGFLFGGKRSILPLDGFIDKLVDLVFFYANSNNFTGTVPNGTAQHRFFYELDLSNNKLSGVFPNEVLAASKLTFLDLRFNTFRNTIPPKVFNLDVDVLFLNNNNLVQKIPSSLGSTPAHYITFSNNKFSGSIPRSIGKAANTLYEVLFLKNSLSGCLPMEIGNLKKSTVFDVSFNQLTGPIPLSFGCMSKMQLMNLANNKFYGAVPESVCQLPNLAKLTLAKNYFTQVGPKCRKLIKKGILDIKVNCISDLPNQRSKADCANFFSKPRICPNARSLTFIPCKARSSSTVNDEDKSDDGPQTKAPAPLSYRTLEPHGL